MGDPIVMASDHRGRGLKEELRKRLEADGFEVRDFGTHSEESVDYPRFAAPAARAVSEGQVRRGILICGSGLGVMYTANRVPAGARGAGPGRRGGGDGAPPQRRQHARAARRPPRPRHRVAHRQGLARHRVRRGTPRSPRRDDRRAHAGRRPGGRRIGAGADGPRDRRAPARGGAAPGAQPGADRVGELRLRGGARGGGLRAHEQVRRGLPRPALLRRLRGRRRGRDASPSSAPRSSSAPITPTCSRTPGPRRTRRSTAPSSTSGTRCSR